MRNIKAKNSPGRHPRKPHLWPWCTAPGLCLGRVGVTHHSQDPPSLHSPMIPPAPQYKHTHMYTHTELCMHLFPSLLCWCIYDLMKVYPSGERDVYKMWDMKNPLGCSLSRLRQIFKGRFCLFVLFCSTSTLTLASITTLIFYWVVRICSKCSPLIPRGRSNVSSLKTYFYWRKAFFRGKGKEFYCLSFVIFEKTWHHMFWLLQTAGEAKGSFNSLSFPSCPTVSLTCHLFGFHRPGFIL